MIFKQIERAVKSLFGMNILFYEDCQDWIKKHFDVNHDIQISGKVSKHTIANLFHIYLIKADDINNKLTLFDQVVYEKDTISSLIFIVDKEIADEDYDEVRRIEQVKIITYIIINTLQKCIPAFNGSSLSFIYDYAPAILTAHILSSCINENTNINLYNISSRKQELTERQMRDVLSLDVESLLDRSGIIALLRESEKVKENE